MSRVRVITLEQLQEYERHWNQPPVPAAVDMDEDLNGDAVTEAHKQRTNGAFWVAYCYYHGQGGVEQNAREARRILEQVIQEQDSIDGDNHHDNTGKHRHLLADVLTHGGFELESDEESGEEEQDEIGDRVMQLYEQAVPRLEMEAEDGGNDENYQEAAWCFGICLSLGYGVEIDKPRAI